MSEINNDLVEAVEVEKIEEPTPTVEEQPEVVEAPAVEEKAEEDPVVEKKASKKEPKPAATVANEKVAIFSERNISWQEAGRLNAGYSIVTKDLADKWLTLKGVRLASPEEISSKVAK